MQVLAVRRGVDILITTLSRLLDHVEKRHSVKLDRVELIAVDEADSMLDLESEQELRRWERAEVARETLL